MTLGRIFLTTHQRYPVAIDPIADALDARQERLCLSDVSINCMTFVVDEATVRFGSPAQFTSKIHVLEFRLTYGSLQFTMVELWNKPRIWCRTNIGHDLDPMLKHEVEKCINRLVRVADGVNNRLIVFAHHDSVSSDCM